MNSRPIRRHVQMQHLFFLHFLLNFCFIFIIFLKERDWTIGWVIAWVRWVTSVAPIRLLIDIYNSKHSKMNTKRIRRKKKRPMKSNPSFLLFIFYTPWQLRQIQNENLTWQDGQHLLFPYFFFFFFLGNFWQSVDFEVVLLAPRSKTKRWARSTTHSII